MTRTREPRTHERFARTVSVWCVASLLTLPFAALSQSATSAPSAIDAAALRQIQDLGQQASAGFAPGAARVEIEAGQLDPRLHLAPCERIEAHLPANARAWGRTRVGLRCVQGPTLWNVYLPVTVKVFAAALVAATSLPAGTVLQAAHLREAEVDWAADNSAATVDPTRLLGRALARPMAAGQALRQSDLKQRQWFGAGDTVQVVAHGSGFSVSGEGQALSPGLEGQSVRVRTEGGRIISGQAVGMNRVEVQL
jgi:flagella basal body P-ring formation protein FlgA